MGKFSTAIAFLVGTVFGGAAVWYLTKEWYAQLAEKEITSVKEAYARRDNKKENAEKALHRYQGNNEESGVSDTEGAKTPVVNAKVAEKGSIAEYAQRIQNGAPMKYSKTTIQPEIEKEIPYVISPSEFDELSDYTPVSLTCFADGVLADEYGVIVDNVEEMVGDALDHFGEYEDDAVFVRNDAKRCDYEILRDDRDYEEFRKTLPPDI